MPKNDDGEFELILGNRQLLSVFFIVVILLGVFFTMGYIVGRNTGTTTAELTPVAGADARPPATTEAPVRAPEPAPAQPPSAPTETAPQQPATPAPVGERESEPPKREPRAEARAASGSHPVAGQTYLQLAATSQHEADIMVDVLRKKSFRAMAAEIDEKPGTFRVLVGPITDTTANKMRADLQGAGFPGNAAIRRTF